MGLLIFRYYLFYRILVSYFLVINRERTVTLYEKQ
jgi:hypothetical protein